jgi:hypothetical protein
MDEFTENRIVAALEWALKQLEDQLRFSEASAARPWAGGCGTRALQDRQFVRDYDDAKQLLSDLKARR